MGNYSLIFFIPFIIYLSIVIFAIYFVIKIVKFMNTKIKLDQARNHKIDELIKSLEQRNHIQ